MCARNNLAAGQTDHADQEEGRYRLHRGGAPCVRDAWWVPEANRLPDGVVLRYKSERGEFEESNLESLL